MNKASQKRLAQIAEYVRYNQDIDLVLVSTYTDSTDTNNNSQNLSEQRAEVLREYFKSIGLPEDRIQVQGYGQRRPIADNASPIGKDKNRRVVISQGRTQEGKRGTPELGERIGWVIPLIEAKLSNNLAF